MACNRPDSRSSPVRPGRINIPPAGATPPRRGHRISLERIVQEAIDLVTVHYVAPFDAADWTAGHYNYVDIEAVLQRVREGVDHA